MAKKEKRFEKTLIEASMDGTSEILIDKVTGVHYLFYKGGLTPLLDRDGKPVILDVLPK